MSNIQMNSTLQDNYIKPYRDLFQYVEQHSGLAIHNPRDILKFFLILKTENEVGYELPEWTKSIYPQPLQNTAAMAYAYTNFDPNAKKIQIGYLLQRIINDTVAKIDKHLKPPERKMFMYSVHETTMGSFLQALKLFEPEIPPYGSAIIIELHKNKEDHFLKFKYIKHPQQPTIQDLTVPGCSTLCPVHQFIELQKQNDNLPSVSQEQACK